MTISGSLLCELVKTYNLCQTILGLLWCSTRQLNLTVMIIRQTIGVSKPRKEFLIWMKKVTKKLLFEKLDYVP